MWIHSKDYFFSVVKYKNGLNVRFRQKSHADRFKADFGGTIIEVPMADYAYRIFIEREELTDVMLKIADGIDYTNFKNEVWNRHGDVKEHNAMMFCWQAMREYQDMESK